MKLGTTVSLTYTGTLDDGSVFGYAKSEQPMVFQTGMEMVIDGFEEEILQMNEVGERKKFTLDEYHAYGEYLENRLVEVPLREIPSGCAKVGMRAYLPGDTEEPDVLATCIATENDHAVFDLNHPLAGKRLTFEVEIISLEDAPDNFMPLSQRNNAVQQQFTALGL